MQIVIQESKWCTQNLCEISTGHPNKYCALGFMGKRLEIADDAMEEAVEPGGLEPEDKSVFWDHGLTDELETKIIKINDFGLELTDRKKEALIELFKEMGHTLKFIE